MQLNIKEILKFYDERNPANGKHASAITGVIGEDIAIGIFCHFADAKSWSVTVRDEPCTQGTKKGNWLDNWLYVESDNENWLFQVEVKNWSAHSLGGKHLALDATATQLAEFKKAKWREQWDEANETFRHAAVVKVLSAMRSPLQNCRVEPLVIYWFAIHHSGADEPFFEVKAQGEFKRVFVFSISSYLRSLNQKTIQIDAPRVAERFRILQGLFSDTKTDR